jgi:hypothetical protein
MTFTKIIFDTGSLADKAVAFLSGCCSVGDQGRKKEGRVWWTWDGQGRNIGDAVLPEKQ